MKPLSERIKEFSNDQFVDWLCLACVDVREVRTPGAAQEEINKIRAAVTERLTVLDAQRSEAEHRLQLVRLQRDKAAETKLAEYEKQEPYGFTHNHLAPPDNDCESIGLFKRENRHYGRPLFMRPAPAVSLTDLVPVVIPKDVYQVVYQECGGFVDCPADATVIWKACRAAILRNIGDSKNV